MRPLFRRHARARAPSTSTPRSDRRFGCALACSVAALVSGCGGDPKGGALDTDTFGGMNQAEIRADCMQTVQCKGQQYGAEAVSETSVDTCVLESAKLLNASEDRQQKFLADRGRFRAFVVCDYVTCAQSGGATYGDMQRDKIQHACGAEVECNLVRGTMGDDANVCAEKKVNQLNTYVEIQRQRWEASYDACKSEVGCGYVDCFDAAFFGATASAGMGM